MKKKLIYILGAGRSGTTILDIVLGNSSNAISLGEINRFFKRNGIAPKRDPENKVFVFWNSIKKSFEQNQTIDYGQLNKMFHINEYHTNFLKTYFFGPDDKYKDILQKQYSAIAQNTTDKEVLIESSKYPTRALNISKAMDDHFDIGYIYLKKDPVKVVSSFQKKGLEQPAKSYFASNVYYLAVNFFCYLSVWKLRKRGHTVVVLKYDDLIAKPMEVLDRIGVNFSIDISSVKEKIHEDQSLDTGFLFDGNRIRLKESIILQKDLNVTTKKNMSYYFTRGFNYLIYR